MLQRGDELTAFQRAAHFQDCAIGTNEEVAWVSTNSKQGAVVAGLIQCYGAVSVIVHSPFWEVAAFGIFFHPKAGPFVARVPVIQRTGPEDRGAFRGGWWTRNLKVTAMLSVDVCYAWGIPEKQIMRIPDKTDIFMMIVF